MTHALTPQARISFKMHCLNFVDSVRAKLIFGGDGGVTEQVVQARLSGQTGLLLVSKTSEESSMGGWPRRYAQSQAVTRADLIRGDIRDKEEFGPATHGFYADGYEITEREVVNLKRPLAFGKLFGQFRGPQSFTFGNPA